MNAAGPARLPARGRTAALVLAGAAALALLLVAFPWDLLRGPVNRYASEALERKFKITRHLDVELGWRRVTVRLDGVEIANPPWAREPYLLRAQKAEFEIDVRQLLAGRLVLPRLALSAPSFGLQLEEDGRRTWAFGDTDADAVPTIGLLQVDGGTLDFLARGQGADLHAEFTVDGDPGDLPLRFRMQGRYQQQPFTAEGRTGNVLQLAASGHPPFPLAIDLRAGHARLEARGTLADPGSFDGLDVQVEMRGRSLGNLYFVFGVALPQTPPYAISGQLRKRAALWEVRGLQGRLGLSDIGGDLDFDDSGKVPLLSGSLRSRVLHIDDLAPFIGLPPTTRSARAVEGVEPPPPRAPARSRQDPGRKLLPDATLDFERLNAMNAEVGYSAETIRYQRELPLDKASVRIALKDGVLALDPLRIGIAGGQLSGAFRIDAAQSPADIRAAFDVRALQLERLVPRVGTVKTRLGRVDGRINLSGRGKSMASWLADASGDVAAMTSQGEISALLLELLGLDGAEILKFLLIGDRPVAVRCAALAFDVEQGVMNGRTLVFDTSDTLFTGAGHIDLRRETMNLVIQQRPKDKSLLVARSPLRVGGSFASPKVGVQAGPLVARGAAVVALVAANPLLGLAATVETGRGRDADCREVLAEAKRPDSRAAAAGAAKARRRP